MAIITFVIASSASLNFFLQSFKDSPREVAKLVQSLEHSAEEVTNLMSTFQASIEKEKAEDPHTQRLAASVEQAARQAEVRLEEVMELAMRMSKMSNQPMRLRNRGRFVLAQEDLTKKIVEKDRAMEELRLAKDRSVYPTDSC